MRNNIVHVGADELTYEIREIVEVAREIERLGQPIIWENIGDPVQKGEDVPDWIKEKVREQASRREIYGYAPTKGLERTRRYLAEYRKKKTGTALDPENIVFFNGLGDAISKVFTYLHRNARVIGPSPAYSTHSSAEAAHAGAHHITYNLDPKKNWLPDLNDLRNKIHYNPQISGILIINPDNPTGMVYPRRVLEEMVNLAREYDLFLVSDEIYENIVYGGEKMVTLAEVAGDIPAIAMKGISKEMPWPGARCGWIEVYNRERDPVFSKYIQAVINAKMLEVCSTTLPQALIPEIFSDPRYEKHLRERSAQYEARAALAYESLKSVGGIHAPKANGAFYMTIVFDDETLHNGQALPIENERVREFVEARLPHLEPDKRFVYYLMGATGICVVPLSGFNSDLYGFRITLLESQKDVFKHTLEMLKKKIPEYLAS